jgi:membrane-associated phospholipid phosphatase
LHLKGYLTAGLGACCLLVFLFSLIAEEIVLDRRDRFDRAVSADINAYANPHITEIVRDVTVLGSTVAGAVLCALMLGWLALRRQWATATVVAIAFLGAKLLESALKSGFERARPDVFPHLAPAGGYSFPSGHTMTAVITYGLLAVVVADHLRGRSRLVPPLLATVIVITVGFSRVYLGVHYLTDVIAGMLVASICLIAAMLALRLCDRCRQPVALPALTRRSAGTRHPEPNGNS